LNAELFNAGGDWNVSDSNESAENKSSEQLYPDDGQSRNHTAMILFAICTISMLGVYIFGMRQKPQEATAQEKAVEAQVDTALAKLVDKNKDKQKKTQKLFDDTGKMVQAFYEYPTNQQVALDELQKNPFSRFSLEGDEEPVVDLSRKRARLEKILMKFKLQSVLHGASGAKCLINGTIFGEGQVVENTFNIKAIQEDNVILEAGEMEFELRM